MAKRELHGTEFTCSVCEATHVTEKWCPTGWTSLVVHAPTVRGGHERTEQHFCGDACYAAWKADGKEPCKGDTLGSLRAEARDLGERAARANRALSTARAYLEEADRVHGEECRPASWAWLGSTRDYVDSLCKSRALDPQPERALPLREAARVLGQRAGQENDIVSTASALLCAAEETSHAHVGYPRILHLVVDDIVRRLANGKW